MSTMSDEAMLMDLGIDVTERSREQYELERQQCVHCGDVCREGAFDEDFDGERVCYACQSRGLPEEPDEPDEPEALALVAGEHEGSRAQLICYAALFFVGFAGLVHTFIHPSIAVTLVVALVVAGFGTHRVHHAHSFAG